MPIIYAYHACLSCMHTLCASGQDLCDALAALEDPSSELLTPEELEWLDQPSALRVESARSGASARLGQTRPLIYVCMCVNASTCIYYVHPHLPRPDSISRGASGAESFHVCTRAPVCTTARATRCTAPIRPPSCGGGRARESRTATTGRRRRRRRRRPSSCAGGSRPRRRRPSSGAGGSRPRRACSRV